MSEIVPSRPIFSSKADSSVKKNPKKRKKNGKGKVGGKKKKNVKKAEKEYKTEAAEDSDLDLEKELMSIGAYINNRELMLEHVFKSIQEHKLQSLIPDILKNTPIDQLKEMCYHQLEGMSKKRIRYIIAGEEMNSSSGTEDSCSDDGKATEDDKLREPSTRDTSPDTSTVVHSTCDSQGEGVGSSQTGVDDAIVSTVNDAHDVDAGPGDDAIEIGRCSPIKSEEDEEEKMEEDDESVTSEEMEEGSEDGEVRSARQQEQHVPGTCKDRLLPGVDMAKEDLQVTGSYDNDEEVEEERMDDEEHNEDEEEQNDEKDEQNEHSTGVPQSSSETGNLNSNLMAQSTESSKPSSELEILELELRARAIRSLMQKVAQSKENK